MTREDFNGLWIKASKPVVLAVLGAFGLYGASVGFGTDPRIFSPGDGGELADCLLSERNLISSVHRYEQFIDAALKQVPEVRRLAVIYQIPGSVEGAE